MEVIDVEGAFLHGEFENGEVPDGVEKYYGKQENVVLLTTKNSSYCRSSIGMWQWKQTIEFEGSNKIYTWDCFLHVQNAMVAT